MPAITQQPQQVSSKPSRSAGMKSGSFARKILANKDEQVSKLAMTINDKVEADEDAIEDVFATLAATIDDSSDALVSTDQDKPFAKILNAPESSAPLQSRLGDSVRRGELNSRRALQASRFVDNEVSVEARIGQK